LSLLKISTVVSRSLALALALDFSQFIHSPAKIEAISQALVEKLRAKRFSGGVAWLSSRMSKHLSKMGAWHVVHKAAEQGDIQASILIGLCYAIGHGNTPQDDKEAARYFRKGADGGNPEVALVLGTWILEGRGGLKRDPADAVKYIEMASSKNLQEAHTMYGIMCNEGLGTLRDHQKAASLFSRAAAGGDLKALYHFGMLQIEGRGVKSAHAEGIDAVRRAATGGIAEAQLAVSIWYRDGAFGTKQDDRKALEWAMKAAKQGHTHPQHNVGVVLAEGAGVAKNRPLMVSLTKSPYFK
jgi:TPR repeat protein